MSLLIPIARHTPSPLRPTTHHVSHFALPPATAQLWWFAAQVLGEQAFKEFWAGLGVPEVCEGEGESEALKAQVSALRVRVRVRMLDMRQDEAIRDMQNADRKRRYDDSKAAKALHQLASGVQRRCTRGQT